MAVPLKFTADDAELQRANDKAAKGANEMASAYKRVNRESQELNRLVARGAREGESATARWKRQTDLLNRSFKTGKISQQELQQSLASVNRELDEFNKELEDAKTQTEETSDSFGGLATKLSAFASGAFTFSTITSGLKEISDNATEAAEKLVDLVATQGQLQQISGSPEQLRQLGETATRFFASGALGRSEANQLGFDFSSLVGVSDPDSERTFLNLAKNRVVTGEGLSELAAGVSQLNQSFKQGAGGTTAIISKAFLAAAPTPANVQQILGATGQAAPLAKQVGIGDEDTLSAISVLSRSFGTADRAGVRLERLLGAALRKGIEGDTITELVTNLQKAVADSGKASIQFLGSKEATAALQELSSNQKQLADLISDLRADEAGGQLALRGKLDLFDSAPGTLTSAARLQESRALLELSRDELGTGRASEEALINLIDALRRELGGSEIVNLIDRVFRENVLLPVVGKTRPTVDLLQQAEAAANDNAEVRRLLTLILQTMESLDGKSADNRIPSIPVPEAN